MSKYYCKVCKKDHAGDGNTVDYCQACQMEHPHNRWKSIWGNGKPYTVCGNHYKSFTPLEKRWDNYSPEEIMAGVPYGNTLKDAGLGDVKESGQNWSEEHKEEVSFAKEALSF